MKLSSLITVILLIVSPAVSAQQTDTLIKKLDSLNKKADTAGVQQNNIREEAYNENTRITFKNYFVLLGSDFKQQLTEPFHLTKRDWLNIGKFGVVAVGVGLGEQPIQRFGFNFRRNSQTVTTISNYVTQFGAQYEAITLVTLGAYGLIFKNEKLKNSTLLATQACITSVALHYLVKEATGRQRPSYINPEQGEPRPTFHGPFRKPFVNATGEKVSSSFPSGHTTLAFAAATVYAMEYRDKPLVHVIAYSAASLVGMSRITENRHWATDVLTGAALGYLCGRQVVNNYHRFAKLKAPHDRKNTVSFNLQYNYGKLMPGIVYALK